MVQQAQNPGGRFFQCTSRIDMLAAELSLKDVTLVDAGSRWCCIQSHAIGQEVQGSHPESLL